MKKHLVWLLLVCAPVLVTAEQMQFVTTMSSPMGTFSVLETADPLERTSVPLVNFCNSRASVGTLSVNGANAYIQSLQLKNGTTLGGNSAEYRTAGTLQVGNGGKVTGGRLMASQVTVENASDPKSKVENNLYLTTGRVKGARTNGLTIPGKVKTSGSGNGEELEWSNIYAKEYKSDGSVSGSATYTSYLLKTKVRCIASEGTACTGSGGSWDNIDCTCTCPSNMILKNGKCIGKFSPKVIDVGVLVDCHYCPNDRMKQCGTSGADPTFCYYGGDFDTNQGCQHGGSASSESSCKSRLGVNFYVFFNGGYLQTGGSGGSCTGQAIFWTGGTAIGGQQYRYSGQGMPNCYGGDHQTICDDNCTAGSSSCTYKCLVSKTVNGCNNGCYRCSNGWHDNSGSGTGKVLTCVAS